MLLEGDPQVLHEFLHHLLGRLGEIPLDIHLADSFAEKAIGNCHSPSPTGPLLLDTGHLTAEEIEVCVVEVVAEGRSATADDIRYEIVLEDGDVLFLEVIAESLEEGRLTDDDLGLIGNSSLSEIRSKIESGICLAEILRAHGVVSGFDIPLLNA